MNTALAKQWLRDEPKTKYGPWMMCPYCGAQYFTLWFYVFHINHYCRKV